MENVTCGPGVLRRDSLVDLRRCRAADGLDNSSRLAVDDTSIPSSGNKR
jgi:hypothetical protein